MTHFSERRFDFYHYTFTTSFEHFRVTGKKKIAEMATTEQTVENNNTQMLDVVSRTQIVTDLDTIKQLENTVDCQKETQDKMTFDLEYLQSVLSYMSNLRVPITLEGEHEKIHEYCRLIESIAEVCQVKVRELKERYDEFISKTCDEFYKMKIEGRKIMQESCVSDHGEEYQDHPQEAIKAMTPEENEDELNGSLYDSDFESQNMLETERERLPQERSKPCSDHQPQNILQSERKSLPQESDEPNTDNQLCCLDPRKMIFCKRSCGLVALQVMLYEEGVRFCMSRFCQKLQQITVKDVFENKETKMQEKLGEMDGLLPCTKVLPVLNEKGFLRKIFLKRCTDDNRGLLLEDVKNAFKNSKRNAGVLLYHTNKISHCVNLVKHMKEVKIYDGTNGRDNPIDFDKALSAQVVVLSFTNDENDENYGISVIASKWFDCYSDICKTEYVQSHANNRNLSCSSRMVAADGL
ncbi:uncharacterized protein LOC124449352 isoform X1 [Xenia sp. Carnegie-2017]|uniref:uncharacterized protein LOC124449352 isoform X1 n=2 Tax=Xenia sp. Carnegie-2017 TaxID=2897299 RepID=UPI001F03E4F2|nr:uncharacterized protein LOC124449352 isoform X1 [Xenia sp. Carnegie-2017]XP_046856245.1 uncharacterized protein LOC124449352 isoform X1 [Xenia sp. Carnegie-2017]